MTLREYISFWQGTYDKHQSRPTTYAAHNYVFKNHILPGLGDVLLSELTSEMVGEFLEERKRFGNHRPGSSGLGEETMRHIHRLLQQCLDQAMRDGLITENPAKSFHYRKSTTVKADIMTPLEMEDYLDAAEQLGYLPMFMLALTTGIRQGELIALKWSDLDMKKKVADRCGKPCRGTARAGGVRQSDKDDSTDTRGNRPPNQGTRQAPQQPAHVYASGHAEALLAADGAPDAQGDHQGSGHRPYPIHGSPPYLRHPCSKERHGCQGVGADAWTLPPHDHPAEL